MREGEAADVFYILTGGAVALETHLAQRGPVTVQTFTRASCWDGHGLRPPTGSPSTLAP